MPRSLIEQSEVIYWTFLLQNHYYIISYLVFFIKTNICNNHAKRPTVKVSAVVVPLYRDARGKPAFIVFY
jgi:hypothetical protein